VFVALQVLTVIFVAVAMAVTLAHAPELPEKMRLSKEQYLGMQPIYYPEELISVGAPHHEPKSLHTVV
jgi:hypothetical protein